MHVCPTRPTPPLNPALPRSKGERSAGQPAVENALGLGDRLAGLFEDFYVDLEEVRSQRGLDPVAALRGLEHPSELLRVFRQLGDRHTLLALDASNSIQAAAPALHWSTDKALVRPPCLTKVLANGVLHLPFRLDRSTDSGCYRLWVTEVSERAPAPLSPGVEVTHWNGVPVSLAADLQGRWHRGAHPEARRALGLASLAQRLLGTAILPCEDWVRLSCRNGGSRFEVRVDWQADLDDQPSRTSSQPKGQASWRSVLSQPHSGDGFRCGVLPQGAAYLRLFSLPDWAGVEGPLGWLRWFATRRPKSTLLLDLRGNAGGSVHTATRLARLLGEQRPMRQGSVLFQFRDTIAVRRMLNLHEQWRDWAAPWHDFSSKERKQDVRYLHPLPLHPPELLDDIRPLEFRKIVLLVDALTYSAAEILVALLRRSSKTLVVGTDHQTGGSTANAWSFETLRRLHPDLQIKLPEPQAAGSAITTFCLEHHLHVTSQALNGDHSARQWYLESAQGSRAVVSLAPDLSRNTLNVYWRSSTGAKLKTSHTSINPLQPLPALPKGVDLQLAVRRAVLPVGDRCVPLIPKPVDHWLPITQRDVFNGNRDLLQRAVELPALATLVVSATNHRLDPKGSRTEAP